MKTPMERLAGLPTAVLVGMMMVAPGGCATEPKEHDQPAFIAAAQARTEWFETRVPGLRDQIASSAGYIIYPSIGQWGIIYTGGKFGRGMVNRPDGAQIGWAAINATSLGLQAGVQGFRMLVIFENKQTSEKFMANRLTGSVSGVAVVGETGVSGQAKFENGVAVYEGANTGLMAGVKIGLNYMRFKPLTEPE